MTRFLPCFLILTADGCIGGGRCLAGLPQTTLAPLQCTLPAKSAPLGHPCFECGCPCGEGKACTCLPGQCNCRDSCPGRVTLAGLKERAMAENKKLVVWTGTPGRNVPDCLACRDERSTSVTGAFPFVSVGVPSANGLVWWQFPATASDATLQTVRTDGTHDGAAAQAPPLPPAPPPSDWRYWQTAYPYLNAAPMPAWQPAAWAPQAMSYAPAFGCAGGT
jgi:hypothetical protein